MWKAFLSHKRKKIVVHIRALKRTLNNGLVLKRLYRVTQFNQKASLKAYIGMNTKLRKEAKNEFEKDFFKLMNNAVFGKTMENVRKHRDIKLVTTDKRRNQLVSEPNYHTTKYFSENLLAIEMKKTKVKKNKPVYHGMALLDNSKKRLYGFWYDYIKPRYRDIVKLCYTDTNDFIIYIKTEDFYENIAGHVERLLDTFDYDENKTSKRPLPIGKNKKLTCHFKDVLGGKIKKEFWGLRIKHMNTYWMMIVSIKKLKKPRNA